MDDWQQQRYCWVGSGRFSTPLDPTTEKKWRLMTQGLEVPIKIIGFSTSARPRVYVEHAHFYLLPNLSLSILRYLVFFLLAPILMLWVIFRHNVTVLVAQSPFEGSAAALIKQVARLLGKRVYLVVENHNNFEEDLFMQRRILMMALYRKLMMTAARFAFNRADALRVISQSTHDRAEAFAPGRPMVRFMTWSDVDIFRKTPRTVPLTDTKDIVYAGVLIPRKGVHLLIEAFARLNVPESNLYLVGHPENQSYAEMLRKLADDLKVTDRVHFVGGVSQQKLADYMARSRVMALPSLSEGLGRVVVEAMLCGTPVVASRVGGIPDMVTPGDNGYLAPPDNVDALYEALNQIMTHEDIEAMGSRAREFALRFFSPEAYVDGHRQLFRAVFGETAPHEA